MRDTIQKTHGSRLKLQSYVYAVWGSTTRLHLIETGMLKDRAKLRAIGAKLIAIIAVIAHQTSVHHVHDMHI